MYLTRNKPQLRRDFWLIKQEYKDELCQALYQLNLKMENAVQRWTEEGLEGDSYRGDCIVWKRMSFSRWCYNCIPSSSVM